MADFQQIHVRGIKERCPNCAGTGKRWWCERENRFVTDPVLDRCPKPKAVGVCSRCDGRGWSWPEGAEYEEVFVRVGDALIEVIKEVLVEEGLGDWWLGRKAYLVVMNALADHQRGHEGDDV